MADKTNNLSSNNIIPMAQEPAIGGEITPMASNVLSQLKLGLTTYNLKDRSGDKSEHLHTFDQISGDTVTSTNFFGEYFGRTAGLGTKTTGILANGNGTIDFYLDGSSLLTFDGDIKPTNNSISIDPQKTSLATMSFKISNGAQGVYPGIYATSSNSSYLPYLGVPANPWQTIYTKSFSVPTGSSYISIPAMAPSANNTTELGTNSNAFQAVYTNAIGTGVNGPARMLINSSLTDYFISVNCTFRPTTNAGASLGTSSYRWGTIYSNTSLNTSERASKYNINYIEQPAKANAPKSIKAINSTSSVATNNNATSGDKITTDDVIDFVSTISPVTFIYKDAEGNEVSEENAKPEFIQLGLIADDIKDHKLFKYIGAEMDAERIIEPEEVDEETGEVIKEAVKESYKTLGLKDVALTTAALTACKYLLNEVKTLKEEIESLKSST